jgi:hypothetical protein
VEDEPEYPMSLSIRKKNLQGKKIASFQYLKDLLKAAEGEEVRLAEIADQAWQAHGQAGNFTMGLRAKIADLRLLENLEGLLAPPVNIGNAEVSPARLVVLENSTATSTATSVATNQAGHRPLLPSLVGNHPLEPLEPCSKFPSHLNLDTL